MSDIDIRNLIINRKEAWEILDSTTDPVLKAILKLFIEAPVMRFIRPSRFTYEEYRQQLPAAPFDMLFYIRVIKALFSWGDVIRRILDGEVDAAERIYSDD